MSRLRSIKPDFWSSEQVMALTRDARLLFIGMWNFADDMGRSKWSAKGLKAQVLPGDFDVTEAMIDGWLSEMVQVGLLERYSVDGKEYCVVTGWAHQKISHPQPAKHPPPPEKSDAAGAFTEHSRNAPGTLQVDSLLIGSELIGSEGSAGARPPEVPLTRVASDRRSENTQAPRSISGSHTQTFDTLFRQAASERRIKPAPSLSQTQRLEAIGRALEYGDEPEVGGFERGAAALIAQAFDDSAVTGEKVCFTLTTAQPGKPAQPRNRSGPPQPAKGIQDVFAARRAAGSTYVPRDDE